MCVATIPAYGRDLIDEQAREQGLHVGPVHPLNGFRRRWEPEGGRLFRDSWSAKPLAQQKFDRRYPSADVRHGDFDSLPRSALAALER
jgi:hypothetical protein